MRISKQKIAWAFYDWANSAFATVILAAVLPVYYTKFIAESLPPNERTAYWGYSNFAASLLIALTAPILGGIADRSNSRKKFWVATALIGIVATACLSLTSRGEIFAASAIFVAAMFGFGASELFYNSFLMDVADAKDADFVSNLGYAMGYIGGGLLLAFDIVLILKFRWFGLDSPFTAMKWSFVSVALWWLVFSLPSWIFVRERTAYRSVTLAKAVSLGLKRFIEIFRELMEHRDALTFLLAFWVYNDGIVTIVKMAVAYGSEIGIGQADLIKAILLVQFVAAPFALLFGVVTRFVRAKHVLIFALLVYMSITLFGYKMRTARDFYLLAIMVATVQGGAQALSRSIFSRLIPPDRKAEFFGFYSLSGKFSSVLGPLLVGLVAQTTGTGRKGVLVIALFFAIGIAILLKVKDKG